MKQEVWVLTSEHNDYDQHGAYFEAVWLHKPSTEDLKEYICSPALIEWVLQGGGREKYEDVWYNLTKHEKEVK